MMIMRPPQQGHVSASGLPGAVSLAGAAVASSSRARAMVGTRGVGDGGCVIRAGKLQGIVFWPRNMPCVCRKLDSAILMVEAAKDRP